MKILITGASGFVGWNAVRYFDDREFFVQPTFRSLPHYLHYHSEERVQRPVQLDITNRRAIFEVVNRFRPNFILHCAALARPQQTDSPDILDAINVRGTVSLADAAASIDARILFLSTDLVYPADAGHVDESSPTAPSGAGGYAASKLAAENALRGTDAHWTVIRPTLMFGLGTPGSNSFTQFLDRAWEAGTPAPVFSDQTRSFLYVGDLLTALEAVIRSPEAVEKTFVCGGSEPVTRADFALRYAKFRGVDRSLCNVMRSSDLEGYVGGPSTIILDSSRLRKLGWRPRTLTECFGEMEAERGNFVFLRGDN